MEDYMVKYYAEKLFPRSVHDSSEEEDAVNSPSTCLEDVQLFFISAWFLNSSSWEEQNCNEKPIRLEVASGIH